MAVFGEFELSVALLLGGAISLLVCWRALWLGRRLGVLDVPDGVRKVHAKVTPQVGGIAVMLPVMPVIAWQAATSVLGPFYGMLCWAVSAFFVLGLIDDRQELRASVRLLLSVAVCLLMLFAVPALEVAFLRFSTLDTAIFLEGWGLLFTLLCLVGLQNAVNLADGRNGLCIGLCLIWTVQIALFAPPHLHPLLAVLALGLIVTLLFNMNDRVFLGDNGSYALGLLIGALAIYVYGVAFVDLPADLVALWFLIPIIDCIRVMVQRIARGASPFASDRNHLHHVLERLMSWNRGLAVYLALVAVPSFAAWMEPRSTLVWWLISLIVYGGILLAARWAPARRKAGGANSAANV